LEVGFHFLTAASIFGRFHTRLYLVMTEEFWILRQCEFNATFSNSLHNNTAAAFSYAAAIARFAARCLDWLGDVRGGAVKHFESCGVAQVSVN
jgi:hypothetical protein